MFENGAIRVKMLIFLTRINSMDIKVLFLTGHLLNMQKTSPRHTHILSHYLKTEAHIL